MRPVYNIEVPIHRFMSFNNSCLFDNVKAINNFGTFIISNNHTIMTILSEEKVHLVTLEPKRKIHQLSVGTKSVVTQSVAHFPSV